MFAFFIFIDSNALSLNLRSKSSLDGSSFALMSFRNDISISFGNTIILLPFSSFPLSSSSSLSSSSLESFLSSFVESLVFFNFLVCFLCFLCFFSFFFLSFLSFFCFLGWSSSSDLSSESEELLCFLPDLGIPFSGDVPLLLGDSESFLAPSFFEACKT